MADESGGQAMAGKKIRLERQQAQQLIPKPGIVLHPVLPPRPDLGCDIVGSLQGRWLQGTQYPQREARRVDGDQNVRCPRFDIGDRPLQECAQFQYLRQDLQQPHQRQGANGKQAGHPLCFHGAAADSREHDVGTASPDRTHQPRTENISALFAGDEVNQRHTLGRVHQERHAIEARPSCN
jgi:hypothetical protein